MSILQIEERNGGEGDGKSEETRREIFRREIDDE